MLQIAEFYPQKTGLDVVLHFGQVDRLPCLLVANGPGKFKEDDSFLIKVSLNPEVQGDVKISNLNDIYEWVKLNHELLIGLWEINEIGDGDVVSILTQFKKL
jgi:hypothetical protein